MLEKKFYTIVTNTNKEIFMKKKFGFGIICTLFFLLVSACTSTSEIPYFYAHGSTNYEILGEVFYESNENPGFIEFLRVARDLYPECDFVIDIMVDQIKKDTALYFPIYLNMGTKSSWVMRGTAIRYK